MTNLITSDLYALANKYKGIKEDTDVAVGLRPSGNIHLGNMSVLAFAGIIAKEIGHGARVNTTICDIDAPDTREWQRCQNGYTAYFKDLPDKQECHPNMLEHSIDGITRFTAGIEKVLGVRYFVQLLSDIQRQESFRVALKKVVEAPNFMRFLIPYTANGKVLVYPICKECGTSDCQPSIYKKGTLSTKCTNPSCSTEDYDMKIEDCSRDLSVHWFIDPLRDRVTSPKSRMHVFGGDYRELHGGGNLSKIEKIIKVMQIAAPEIPDIFVGPPFHTSNGKKMSKTEANGLTMDALEKKLGSHYEPKIVELMEKIAREGHLVVNQDLVEDILFK